MTIEQKQEMFIDVSDGLPEPLKTCYIQTTKAPENQQGKGFLNFKGVWMRIDGRNEAEEVLRWRYCQPAPNASAAEREAWKQWK
ncbi:MAG: hypothetical protein ACFB0D_02035 [Phormidesmis sp.]